MLYFTSIAFILIYLVLVYCFDHTEGTLTQDALLASIAENEKQTELATRVSTWKQRIEQALEEQVSARSWNSSANFKIHHSEDSRQLTS